ncbi:hypothetical protein [Macrococcus carouselicus]|uniref:Uncharacterized protein n=1 Tax=Macrococcus carouselicus TaxID=69969 RepID=A0A9Q8CPF9_9STAP|nr:hypothetical protein [Macrococcus carouselicus]TDM04275.1 hypothetical protein ERX40_03665 [Macrococcus carouselicus]
MDFYEQYREDNLKLEMRYPLYRCPAVNTDIVNILVQLSLADNIKKSIIAIDSAMRLAGEVDADNKDETLLATDILSAQFYHYNAEAFDKDAFTLLTQAVMRYNIVKASFDESHDPRLIPEIEAMFVLPFTSIDHPSVIQLIRHSKLYNK